MVEHLRRPVEARNFLAGARALDRTKDGELVLDAPRGRRRPHAIAGNKARNGADCSGGCDAWIDARFETFAVNPALKITAAEMAAICPK